jgi:hypothetical protein
VLIPPTLVGRVDAEGAIVISKTREAPP